MRQTLTSFIVTRTTLVVRSRSFTRTPKARSLLWLRKLSRMQATSSICQILGGELHRNDSIVDAQYSHILPLKYENTQLGLNLKVSYKMRIGR